jgi:pimeloyl-ACP methyl ester carboxylesterase
MLIKITRAAGVLALTLFINSGIANAYDYPFKDPLVATILATPPNIAMQLPVRKLPIKNDKILMFPEREVPDIFWHEKRLQYSYLRQKKSAPMIFLLAGTGASYQSPKMLALQKVFYSAGYHVVSISSPTHPNFIVAASTSGVPGNLTEDAKDIYSVMEAIWLRLQKKHKKMEVTDFYLTGYSLGGTQAAYLAKLDEEQQSFNFRRVLLINPAVSLYNSVSILDAMVEDNIPGGPNNFQAWYSSTIDKFAQAYERDTQINFNDKFLYEIYKYRRSQGLEVKEQNLKVLIGASFRISSQGMVFTSDVMSQANYVVPKGLQLDNYKDHTLYAKILARRSFLDYFNGIFVPYFQKGDPTLTAEKLIQTMGLANIESYLRSSPKIGVIDNEDDIILAPGEIDFLRDVFGSRATIYPHGGHCGNMNYPENVGAMLNFFAAPDTASATAAVPVTAESESHLSAGAH